MWAIVYLQEAPSVLLCLVLLILHQCIGIHLCCLNHNSIRPKWWSRMLAAGHPNYMSPPPPHSQRKWRGTLEKIIFTHKKPEKIYTQKDSVFCCTLWEIFIICAYRPTERKIYTYGRCEEFTWFESAHCEKFTVSAFRRIVCFSGTFAQLSLTLIVSWSGLVVSDQDPGSI
jgi:hypothetical protein